MQIAYRLYTCFHYDIAKSSTYYNFANFFNGEKTKCGNFDVALLSSRSYPSHINKIYTLYMNIVYTERLICYWR